MRKGGNPIIIIRFAIFEEILRKQVKISASSERKLTFASMQRKATKTSPYSSSSSLSDILNSILIKHTIIGLN